MREKLLKLLIAAMLFASMEGMADSIDNLTIGLASDAGSLDSANQPLLDDNADDSEGDLYNHYCHAHFVGLMTNYAVVSPPRYRFFSPAAPSRAVVISAAPPIPPPNI